MSEAEELSLLIGEIYDAALDPALWGTVTVTIYPIYPIDRTSPT